MPAYFYPGVDGNQNGKDDWKDMEDAVEHVGVTAIMNPASGSGTALNADYVTAVSSLRAKGGLVIGYLSTRLGQRPAAELHQEIQNYINWYGVDGFFFDEMPTSFVLDNMTRWERQAIFTYYSNLFNYVNKFQDHSYVIGNPGNLTKEKLLNAPASDALVTLENDITAQTVIDPPTGGALGYTPAPWQLASDHDPTEFAVIQHNVPSAALMESVIDAAIGKGFGLFYVTDDTIAENNPFDRLPTYWDAFVQKIQSASN